MSNRIKQKVTKGKNGLNVRRAKRKFSEELGSDTGRQTPVQKGTFSR